MNKSVQKAILSILTARLRNDQAVLINLSLHEWEELVAHGRKQRVILIIYEFLKRGNIKVPDTVFNKMKLYYRNNALRNIQFERELKILKNILNSAQIQFMLLKGIGLSQYLYQDPALRPSSDIDILVRPLNIVKLDKEMINNGYFFALASSPIEIKAYRLVSHQWPYKRYGSNTFIEVHRLYGPRSRSATIGSDEIWVRSAKISLYKEEYNVMCPEDMLLFLVFHSTKEFWEDWLQLYDIAAIVTKNPSLDWNAVVDRANDLHCVKRLHLCIKLISDVFSVNIPSELQDVLKPMKQNGKAYSKSVEKLFNQTGAFTGLWSTRAWRDLLLADRWRDRISLGAYKLFNINVKFIALVCKYCKCFSRSNARND